MNPATLDICLGDEVLDVGSGNKPHPMATVLVDLYVKDPSHRSGHPLKLDKRPFVCASIEYLPFRDKVFDFVIATHVMEHVENPLRASMEVQRVGKKGYIETPSPWLEQGYYYTTEGRSHWEHHKWYIWNPSQSARALRKREIGKKLIIERKDPYHFDDCRFGHTVRLMMEDIRNILRERRTDNENKNVTNVNTVMGMFSPDIAYTIFYWEGSFEVEVRE